MSIKLILGIIFPIIVITGLIIVESLNFGLRLETKTIESVKIDSLFATANTPKNSVLIRNITIRNDYFTPKKIHLPKLVICLNDKDGRRIRTNFNVRYNEGVSEKESYYASAKDVEIQAHSKKEINVLIEPQSITDYNQRYQTHHEYDELLLIEPKDNRLYYTYDSCQDINNKESDNGVHIEINKIPVQSENVVSIPTKKFDEMETINRLRKNETIIQGILSTCNNLNGSSKDLCIGNLAAGINNPELCELSSTLDNKNTCYSIIATRYGNLSLCNKISEGAGNMKDYCIANTAKRLKNISICDTIQNTAPRNYCLQITK